MTSLLYFARPMGTYVIPAELLVPDEFLAYTILDPALCSLKGHGMDPWLRLVSKCDRVLALTSLNIVTAGVQAELDHAYQAGIPIATPWLTRQPKVLSVSESVGYNKLGVQLCEPALARGFCLTECSPDCPTLLPWRKLYFATATN